MEFFKNNPFLLNYSFYCVAYITLGMGFVAIGPLLPYYSAHQDRPISDFAVLILVRALGYLSGSFSIKITENYLTFHRSISLGFFLSGGFYIGFYFTTNMYVRSVFIYLASFGVAYFDIYSNLATIECYRKKNLEGTLQFLHACMGIGGLTIPFVVYALEQSTYFYLGIFSLFMGILPLFLKSPQIKKQKAQLQQGLHPQTERQQKLRQVEQQSQRNQKALRSMSQKLKNQQQQQQQSPQIASSNLPQTVIKPQSILKTEQGQEQYQQRKDPLPLKSFLIYCLIYFLCLGCQAIYGSWIASYAVMKQYSTKEQATIYNSIFWASITLFRLIFAITPGPPSTKLAILTGLGFSTTLGFVFLIMGGNHDVGLILSAIFIGLCDGPIFGLIQSQPIQFDYQPQQKQYTTFMIFVALGQGLLSAMVGLLFKVTVTQILFYVIAGIFLILFLANFVQVGILNGHKTAQIVKTKQRISEIEIVERTNSFNNMTNNITTNTNTGDKSSETVIVMG